MFNLLFYKFGDRYGVLSIIGHNPVLMERESLPDDGGTASTMLRKLD